MDELISKQAAIDALNQQAETMRGWSERYAEQRKGVLTAVNIVEDLSATQPELHYDEWCTSCKEYDQEKHYCPRFNRVIKSTVEELKSAQSEIIYCKDCKYNPKYEWFGCPMSHLSEKQRPETAWCWKGEMREVTE